MTFVRACGVSELEDDTPKRVELDGTPVSVVRTEGEVFAIHDICSHANVSSPRARWRTVRSSAGCTAPASTSAPASRPAFPRRALFPYTP